MVKPGPPNKLFFPPQQNEMKLSKKNKKTVPRTEEVYQSDPEIDAETTNECDENENENETYPYHDKCDKNLQNDVTMHQRNVTKY